MVLWRICPFQDLNGEGGLLFPARWHFAGNPVVYLAESPAGALLEICANTTADDTSPTLTLLKVDGPDVSIAEIPPNTLPNDWTKRAEVTRPIGTHWLASQSTALLRVPSTLVPETWNYLLPPAPRRRPIPNRPRLRISIRPALEILTLFTNQVRAS